MMTLVTDGEYGHAYTIDPDVATKVVNTGQ